MTNVETFEAFVRGQRPATRPWHPLTDYSVAGRRLAEGRHPALILEVFKPTTILDCGCGPQAALVQMLRGLGASACGFDPIVDGHLRHVWRASVTDAPRPARWGKGPVVCGLTCPCSDLVICREVLEHLPVRQGVQAIRNLMQLSSRYVYLTTRLAPHASVFDFGDGDTLDPTHITLYPEEFLRLIFVVEGGTRRADLERAMDWQHQGRCFVYEVAQDGL